LGLAYAGVALDQKRLSELQEQVNRSRQRPVQDVSQLLEALNDRLQVTDLFGFSRHQVLPKPVTNAERTGGGTVPGLRAPPRISDHPRLPVWAEPPDRPLRNAVGAAAGNAW